MIEELLEIIGPVVLKVLAGAACLLAFAPLLVAFIAPMVSHVLRLE